MKTQLSIATLFAGTFFLYSCNSSTTTNTNGNATDTTTTQTTMSRDTTAASTNMNDGLMAAMNNSMDKMKSMQMSGDFDKDFAAMLIEHHQGAIDMSKIEVAQGSDEKMKSMAQNIITKQTDEQYKLRGMLTNMKPSSMKMGEGELQKSMSDMQNKMSSMQMSGDIDKDFASMMASHHESGISMAKQELKNGMDSKLKQMAQKGIADQQKEVKEFEDWLSSKK